MTRITGEITDAPADAVADFAAGQRNEPAYNPHECASRPGLRETRAGQVPEAMKAARM